MGKDMGPAGREGRTGQTCQEAAPTQRPNIILIVIDAARADHFSCYGYRRKTTPFIDQIAGEGVLYKNAISPAGWTLPAHASMFTGAYPSRHGAHSESLFLPDGLPTLAEVLDKNGYTTCAICRNEWITDATGMTRGFKEFYDLRYSKLETIIKRLPELIKLKCLDTGGYLTNKAAIDWIKKCDSKSPFFLFIHAPGPHFPYLIPAPYNSMFLPEGISYRQAKKVNQDAKKFYAGVVKMDEDDFKISKSLYDGALAYQDRMIWEIYEFLKKKNILDNTIIIITSDHGESLGDHNHLGHNYILYETLIKVPFIVRYPKIFKPGLVVDRQIQTFDIFPTILKILDIDDRDLKGIQGRPIPPVNDGGKIHKFTFAERFKDPIGLKESFPDIDLSHLKKFEDDRKTAIRTDRYKLIYSQNGKSELYDLVNDPDEEDNVIEKETKIAKDLQEEIEKWRRSFKQAKISGLQMRFDEDVKKRLKALGYLG
jgi:arylsulfatase A-like enzyme